MEKKNYFTINFIKGEINGTKRAFAEARKGSGPAYEELIQRMRELPKFKPVPYEQNSHINRPKRSFAGLNLKLIKDYISIQENAKVLQAEFEAIQKNAKEAGFDVFPKVRRWFLEKFNSEDNPFDVNKAKEEINQRFVKDSNESVPNNVIQISDKIADKAEAVNQ